MDISAKAQRSMGDLLRPHFLGELSGAHISQRGTLMASLRIGFDFGVLRISTERAGVHFDQTP